MIHRTYRHLSSPFILRLLILLGAICGLGVAIVYPNAYTIVIPLALLVGVVLAEIPFSPDGPINLKLDGRVLAAAILGGIALTTALYYSAGFQRPFTVHILTACLFAATAVLTLVRPAAAIVLAVAVGLQQRAMVYYSTATHFGLDTLFHQRMVEAVLATGSLEPLAVALSKYFYTPIYHVLVATGTGMTGLPPRTAAFLTASVAVLAVPAVALYAICRRYWTPRAGALAAIFFIGSDYAVTWAVRPRPLTLAVVFFSIVLLSLVAYFERLDRRHWAIVLAVFAALTATHQFSAFTVLVGIGALSIVYFASRQYGSKSGWLVPVTCGVLMLGTWLVIQYSGPQGESPSFIARVSAIAFFQFTETGDRDAIYPSSEHYVPGGAQTLDAPQLFGTGVLFAVAVAGALILLRRRQSSSPLPLALLVVVGLLAAFALSGPLIGFSLLLPYRWFIFLYLAAAVLGGVYLSQVGVPGMASPVPRVLLIAVLIGGFTLVSGANFTAAPDDAPIDSPGAERLTIGPSEAAAMEFTSDRQGDTPAVADYVLYQQLNRAYLANVEMYRFENFPGEMSNDRPLLAIYRPYSGSHNAAWLIQGENGNWFRVHGPIPEPGGGVVYDSGGVWIVSQTD